VARILLACPTPVNRFVELFFMFLKEGTYILEDAGDPPLMKSDAEAAEAFSRYLQFWMDSLGINNRQLSERAARKGAQIGITKINNILLGLYADHQMRYIEAIAIGIGRPPAEVYCAALGYHPPLTEHPEYKESSMAHLWNLLSDLPAGRRKFYERNLQMLANEIQRESNQGHN